MCNFPLAVGCRLNSLINIRVEDIDFTNNMVYLNITKNRKPLIMPLSETIDKKFGFNGITISKWSKL